MTDSLSFRVYGNPVTQGSMRAFTVAGRARVTHDDTKLRPWRGLVAQAAVDAGATPTEGPVEIEVSFILTRPKSAPKRITRPAKKPDLDKLVRGVMDALSGVAWRDDAQVVRVNASKWFADPTCPVGAAIMVQPLTGQEEK